MLSRLGLTRPRRPCFELIDNGRNRRAARGRPRSAPNRGKSAGDLALLAEGENASEAGPFSRGRMGTGGGPRARSSLALFGPRGTRRWKALRPRSFGMALARRSERRGLGDLDSHDEESRQGASVDVLSGQSDAEQAIVMAHPGTRFSGASSEERTARAHGWCGPPKRSHHPGFVRLRLGGASGSSDGSESSSSELLEGSTSRLRGPLWGSRAGSVLGVLVDN